MGEEAPDPSAREGFEYLFLSKQGVMALISPINCILSAHNQVANSIGLIIALFPLFLDSRVVSYQLAVSPRY